MPDITRHTRALVLFSGGQDSTTCLAHALARFPRVETIGFDYGQRHRIELDCRLVVRAALAAQFPHWAARLGDDHLLDLGLLGQISDTALTSDRAITFDARDRHFHFALVAGEKSEQRMLDAGTIRPGHYAVNGYVKMDLMRRLQTSRAASSARTVIRRPARL